MRLRPRTFSDEAETDDVEGSRYISTHICAVNGTTIDAQKIALLSVSTTGTAARWARTRDVPWPKILQRERLNNGFF